ncbi:hypothetical protein Ancab_039365, partial [Ancistrocladus abbreviatus]
MGPLCSFLYRLLHLPPQIALGQLAWNFKDVHTQQSAPHALPIAFYGKQSSPSPSPRRCRARPADARVIPIKGILISPMPVKIALSILSQQMQTGSLSSAVMITPSSEIQSSLPKGLQSFYLNVATLKNHTEVSGFDKCGYAFPGEKDAWNFGGDADLKANAADFEEKIKKNVPVVIEWTVGTENCNQSELNSSGYACQRNTKCVDFDGGTGYRCQCPPGYEGNPYLSPDIDECADPNNNPCVMAATCNNTVGGYSCICPIGQFGDGMNNSFGCKPIHSRSQSATKFGLALIHTYTSHGHGWWARPMEASMQPVLGGQAKYLG